MTHHDDPSRGPDLAPLIDRLHAERPTASALELDAVKQRVRARAARNRSRRTEPMRSRLAILATLVLGMVLSTGGASLAISGFASSDHNAAATQYPVPTQFGAPTPSATPPGGGGSGGGGVSPQGGTVSPQGGSASPQGGSESPEGGSESPEGGGVSPAGGSVSPAGGGTNAGGTAGEEDTGGAQPARQVEAGAQGGSSQLPFTGFAAIPILLGGVALLATGLVLRRRTGDQPS